MSKRRSYNLDTEHREQANLIQWAALNRVKYPELDLLFAIPNGGHRHPVVAAKMKAEGVKAGVPDLQLPVPRGVYIGLFIEMKRKVGGVVSKKQAEWREALSAVGHCVRVCHGWEDAVKTITQYLELKTV